MSDSRASVAACKGEVVREEIMEVVACFDNARGKLVVDRNSFDTPNTILVRLAYNRQFVHINAQH
jgi:hypothetical protein